VNGITTDNAEVSKAVQFDRDGDVAVLTLSHAPHNLVGFELGLALKETLGLATSKGCRAIVLRSKQRHFSAGADPTIFGDCGANFERLLDPVGVLKAFEENPLPIVASVHGVALGGGLELALACDFIVAAQSAKLGLVEASIGLHPLMGGLQRVIQRVGVTRAKEFVMLGRRFDAATLERWGLINRVVPDAQLQEVTMTLAQELARGPTVAHGSTKRLANIYLEHGMTAADAAMAEVQKPIWASEDLQIGLRAFGEKSAGALAVFKGR
jgi:enoyl-CoA hydratase/carnithine racemase